MKPRKKLQAFLVKAKATRLGEIWNSMKKSFNICWKGGLALLFIAMSITMIESLWDTCSDRLGMTHYYWADEDLAGDIEIQHYSDDLCATYNKKTEKRMSPKVKWISGVPDRDSLTVFCDKEGRRGYLNVNTGKVVIDGQYKHAWHFSEGLAAVVADNGKVGFINYDNEMVIPAMYDYVVNYDYLFKDAVCVLPDADTNKYGAIDKSGALKLPMEYSRIFRSYHESTWYIRKDGKCGLADADMNIIFEPIYDNVISNPRERNAYLTANGVKQLVSFDGEVIQPFVIDEAWPLYYRANCHDSEGNMDFLHPYLVEVMVDYNCVGVMDTRTAKMVIPAVYSDISMISKDLLMAQLDGEENNIVFTTSGVVVK